MVKTVTKTATRKLTITFQGDNKLPKFEFEGAWTGHNAGMVLRHMRREYLRYQQSILRQAEVANPVNPSEPKESKDA